MATGRKKFLESISKISLTSDIVNDKISVLNKNKFIMKQPTSRPLIEWVLEKLFHDDVDNFIIWNRMEENGYSITTPCSKTTFEKFFRKYKSYKKRIENKS